MASQQARKKAILHAILAVHSGNPFLKPQRERWNTLNRARAREDLAQANLNPTTRSHHG